MMNYYKRIERRNKKIEKKLKTAPSVYLVVQWAKWGVKECKWTGKLLQANDSPWITPEVYNFTDHNGEYDQWYICPIHYTTSGRIYDWTFNKEAAEKLAEALNAEAAHSAEVRIMSEDEEIEEFFKHYAQEC